MSAVDDSDRFELKKKLDEKKQEKTALASQLKQEHRKLQQEAPVEEEMPDGRTLEQHFNDFPEDIEELRALAASCEVRANATMLPHACCLAALSPPSLSLFCFQAQANAIIGSKDVLERYKAAKAELQAALQRLAELEQLSAKATSVIQQHKDDWLSALKGKLTQIAASFKSYFEGINCRAELRLVEDDVSGACNQLSQRGARWLAVANACDHAWVCADRLCQVRHWVVRQVQGRGGAQVDGQLHGECCSVRVKPWC